MLKMIAIFLVALICLIGILILGNKYSEGMFKMTIGKKRKIPLFAGAPGVSLHGHEIPNELRHYLGKLGASRPIARRNIGKA